jgi:transposase
MSERRNLFGPLPDDTARAARSIFNLGNIYLLIGDQLDQLLAEVNQVELDPTSSYPMSMVGLPALVTIFQFAEGLPDRVAADATRTRMDWKYALHLSINYPGQKPESLCAFRHRLWFDPDGQAIFEQITNRISAMGLLSKREKLDHEALVVIRSVCAYTRLDWMAQAFNQALEALAVWQSECLRAIALPHWYARYNRLSLNEPVPQDEVEQTALAQALGSDAQHLLSACSSFNAQAQSSMPEIQKLCQVFHEQFYTTDVEVGRVGEFYWRSERCATCGPVKNEPYRSA